MLADRLRRNRIVLRVGHRLGQVGVAHRQDHRLIGHLMIRRPRGGAFGALALNLAALVEEVLNPRPRREVGDEVEFVPQPVDFLLAVLVEDQFHQRRVVAEEAQHAVVARAEQPAFVLRIVRKIAPAFRDVEGVREDPGEALECGFIPASLGRRHDQVGVAGARLRRQRRPARSRLLMQSGIPRNYRHHRWRIGIVAQILRIAVPPVRSKLPQLPVQQRLRSRRQTPHYRRRELHRRVRADPRHEIPHLHALRP